MCLIIQRFWTWMKRAPTYCLNQAWHLKRRWGLTSFDRINNNSVATYSDAWGTDPVWSSTVYILNLEMERRTMCSDVFVSICFHEYKCAHTHRGTHRTMLRRDPPICSPSFRKPQNQTQASLFQLPFFPAPSPHHIHLNSPTVSLFFSCFLSPIKCIHVLPSQTRTRTQSHTAIRSS